MSTPIPTSSSSEVVRAAAALRFSVDVDTTRADRQPSVLLLTQNIGGIEAAYDAGGIGDHESPFAPDNSTRELPSELARRTLMGSSTTRFARLDPRLTPPPHADRLTDTVADAEISPAVRQHVAEFLADVRQWLHRLCFLSAAVRAAEAGTSPTPRATADSVNLSSSASSLPQPHNADAYLRHYTPAARPPLVDVIVLHFQEIGGKLKNRRFNEYFSEQLQAMLLPEAGWSTGLLMDKREDGGAAVVSSSYQRRSTAGRRQATEASLWEDRYAIRDTASSSTTDACGDADVDENADPFFTAVGSVVFLSPRVMGIASCLSVPHRTYIPVVDDPLTYAGDTGRLFHSGKLSEAGHARKGFLMVSLRLGTVQLNFCNVHLFNDDDNRVALRSSPSLYSGRRARAMQEVIAECSAVIDLAEPLFVCGDLNVRVDGKALVEWAGETMGITVRPEKKRLRCPEHFWHLFSDPAKLREVQMRFDREPQHLMDEVAHQSGIELAEMPVEFGPSYSRVAYRSRAASTKVSADHSAASASFPSAEAGTLAPPHAAPQECAPPSLPKDPIVEVQDLRTNDGDKAVAHGKLSTPLPSAASSPVSPSQSVSTPMPPVLLPQPSAGAPLTRATASATRDNFCHDRLPAWCDRILFNVAGLEWIAGDRARSAPSAPPAATAAAGVGGGRASQFWASPSLPRTTSTGRGGGALAEDGGATPLRQRAPPDRWYAYAAVDFLHTDHDGVYLLC